MKRFIWFCLAISSQLNAQIHNLNDENRLDVATWNIEWFGHSSSGPSNEEIQETDSLMRICLAYPISTK